MQVGQRLISNSFYLFADWFSVTALSLLYWIIASKNLLPAQYGIVATSVNIALLISGLALIGLNAAVPKFVSEFVEMKKFKKAHSTIAYTLKLTLLLNVPITVVMLLFSPFFAQNFNLPADALPFIAVGVLVASLWTMSTSILWGFQRMARVFWTHLIGYAGKVLITFSLIMLGFAYLGPLYGWITSMLVAIALRINFFKMRETDAIDKRMVILEYAIPAFLSAIIWIFFSNLPNIILNALTSNFATGIFAVALTVTSPIGVIPSTISTAMFPIISGLSAKKNQKAQQRHLVSISTKYTLFITLPLLAALLFFSREVILFFSRPEYMLSTKIFPILAVSGLAIGLGTIFSGALYAARFPKLTRNITLVTGLVFAILAVPLTTAYSYNGMAVAYLVTSLVFASLSFLFLKKRLGFDIPLTELGKIAGGMLVVMGVFWASTFLPLTAYMKLALIFATAFVYFISMLLLKYYTEYDIQIIHFVGNTIPFLRRPLGVLAKIISKNVDKGQG